MSGVIDISRIVSTVDMLQGVHIGTVADNNDPEKRGRVKVAVPVLDGIATNDLSWASILMPVGLGGSSSLSSFAVPEIGTKVALTFPESSVYTPIVIGILHDKSTHQSDFDANYPETYGFKDPKGLTTVINKALGTVSVTHVSGTSVSIAASGAVVVHSPSSITLDPTDTLIVNGNIQLNGRMDSTGDVVAAGISLDTHQHSGITPGPSNTGAPV